MRIDQARDFARLRQSPVRKSGGPLLIYAAPNDLPHPRLGLGVSTRVGGAVKRARIKRLLRESFRILRHDLPAGYDLLVSVRPHEPLTLAEYQRLLLDIAQSLHQTWQKKNDRSKNASPRPSGPVG